MKCTGEDGKLHMYVCLGKGTVMVGDKELSAAREPMRGRKASGMGRSARAARNLYGLFCPFVEKSPFPSKSLPRHSPIAAYRAPSPMGRSRNLQSLFKFK